MNCKLYCVLFVICIALFWFSLVGLKVQGLNYLSDMAMFTYNRLLITGSDITSAAPADCDSATQCLCVEGTITREKLESDYC